MSFIINFSPSIQSDARPEADLRWIHLSAHLAAQKILTPKQIAKYTRLRHAQM